MPDIALIAQELAAFRLPQYDAAQPNHRYGTAQQAAQAGRVPELITCLAEFDFPEAVRRGRHRYYLGPGVDLLRQEELLDWKQIPLSR